MNKEFIFKATRTDDGTVHCSSTNDGFNGLEILGIITWKHADILKQMAGETKPDRVTRTVVVDKEPEQQ